MSELNFTFSLKEEKKVDDYAGKRGVIIHAAPKELGGSNKISFTSLLISESDLQLTGTENVSFGFGPNGQVIAFTKEKQPTSSRIAKNGYVSNKKLHKTMATSFNLDTDVDNLILTSEVITSAEGIKYVNLLGVDSIKKEIVLESIEMEISAMPAAKPVKEQVEDAPVASFD